MDVVGNKPVEVSAALAFGVVIALLGCIVPFPCMMDSIC